VAIPTADLSNGEEVSGEVEAKFVGGKRPAQAQFAIFTAPDVGGLFSWHGSKGGRESGPSKPSLRPKMAIISQGQFLKNHKRHLGALGKSFEGLRVCGAPVISAVHRRRGSMWRR